jgi:hypothetical protein
VALSDVEVVEHQFIGLLSIALFLQIITFHFMYSEQISNYSENLADKFIPQALQSRFGPITTTFAISLTPYIIAFMSIFLFLFLGWNQENLLTIGLGVFVIGSVISPIVQSIYDSDDFTELLESPTSLAIYITMIAFAVFGLINLDQTLGNYVIINEDINMLWFVLAILFAKANYVIDRAFNQGNIMHLFIFIAIPSLLYILKQYQIFADYF